MHIPTEDEVQGGRGATAAAYNQPSCNQDNPCLGQAARHEQLREAMELKLLRYQAGGASRLDPGALATAQERERIVATPINGDPVACMALCKGSL